MRLISILMYPYTVRIFNLLRLGRDSGKVASKDSVFGVAVWNLLTISFNIEFIEVNCTSGLVDHLEAFRV